MVSTVYDALSKYFTTLEKVGYTPYEEVTKLLVLSFYKNLVYSDFKGYLSEEDYHLVEQALDCFYGSSCLIPYPNYLSMCELHLGDISDLAQRVKRIEETDVLKAFDSTGEPSEIIIMADASEEPKE